MRESVPAKTQTVPAAESAQERQTAANSRASVSSLTGGTGSGVSSLLGGYSPIQLQRMYGNRAVLQMVQRRFTPMTTPAIQRVAYHTINYDNETVAPTDGAAAMSFDTFKEDYADLYALLDAGSIVKLTDGGNTALVYSSDNVLMHTYKCVGGNWEEDEENVYNDEEIEYTLDRAMPENEDDLEIARLLKAQVNDDDAVNAAMPQLYNKIADLPDIKRAIDNMPGAATAYEWSVLMTRLTTNPSRLTIADVMEAGGAHFSAGILLNTLTLAGNGAAFRVQTAAGWGNADEYLEHANNMQISPGSTPSHLLATRLAAAVDAGAAIVWTRYQADVHYNGGHFQLAEPRTGFLRAVVGGVTIDIHAHWHRVAAQGQTPGQIVSMHVQHGGANGLEINQWPHLNDLKNEVVNQFNNAAGGNQPSGAGGAGVLALT
ncbi:hypothetical protein B5M42_000190 [Paenibacillus athensensis]|nr:hypothetical protein [Paenibacillus athensensis]MCD1257253.1 hypothetical protein [Paenibacillus athensensis]